MSTSLKKHLTDLPIYLTDKNLFFVTKLFNFFMRKILARDILILFFQRKQITCGSICGRGKAISGKFTMTSANY